MGLGEMIDGVIMPFSPGTVFKRIQHRQLVQRHYEGARESRLRKVNKDNRPIDQQVREANISLVTQARHLERNHDIARGILNVLVAYVIGRGLHIEPQVLDKKGNPADEVNKVITDLYQDWAKFPEVTNTYTFTQVQRLAFRSYLRDGEIFSKMVSGVLQTLNHISKIPFSIEMIETDYLPYGIDQPENGVIDGIRRDAWGRPNTYYLAKRQINDLLYGRLRAEDYRPIDASDIVHCKITDRFRQGRGVSVFAPILNRIDGLKNYEESEMIAARVSASFAGVITRGTPDMWGQDMDYADRDITLEPGKILETGPGESYHDTSPNRPNPNLGQFRLDQLRAMSGGTMTGYSSISRNYDSSYTGHRKEDAEQSIHYGILRDDFVAQFISPIYRRLIDSAITAGLIDTRKVDTNTMHDFAHFGEAMPQLDPWREARTDIEYINARVKSRKLVQRERGLDPAIIKKQVDQEAAADKLAGLAVIGEKPKDVATGSQTNQPD